VDKTFIPKADGKTVAQSFARLQSLVDDLTSVESLDKTLNEKVGRMRQQVSRRAGTASLATANDQYGNNYGNDYNDAYENSGQGITPATMAFHATTRCHPVASTTSFLDGEETQVTDPQTFFTALCHLSVAEDAMRKATGESFPPQLCWGCKDIPRISANQFNHRRMDCPNKNDREVQANAAKSYKEWAQAKRDRQAKRLRLFMAVETSLADRASELETTWEQEGHPLLAQAQCALACAEKSTLPSIRVLAYAKLKGRAEPASNPANNSPPKRGGSTRGGIGFGGGASFLIVAHVAVRALEESLGFSDTRYTSTLVYRTSTCRSATRRMPRSRWRQ
jgi:hypothetical protein